MSVIVVESPHTDNRLKSFLDLPHYEAVRALQQEFDAHPAEGALPQILDRLAHLSPARAAITFCDLVGASIPPIGQIPFQARQDIAQRFAALLERSEARSLIREEIVRLPLVDASLCRELVLGLKGLEAYGPTEAAKELIICPANVERYKKAQRGEGRFYDPSKLDSRRFELAETLLHPMKDTPTLSTRNQAVLDEFVYTVAPPLFPIERYGYGVLRDSLTYTHQRRGLVSIQIPWNDSPDTPSHTSHQCADAASTARSFFSSKGIPSDVYVMTVAGVNHNVAVVFFTEGDRFLPVVVDVSPFGGAYSIENRGSLERTDSNSQVRVDFTNPLGTREVFEQRAESVPVVMGDFPWDSLATGLAPWFGCILPSSKARMVGFGGVVAFQEGSPWLRERGTPEFYGNGERDPYVGFQLVIMTPPKDGESPRIYKCIVGDRRGDDVVEQVSEDVPLKLLHEALTEAKKMIPEVKDFIDRVGFSLEKRVFSIKS
jgi:hypothetical protein